MNRRGTSLTEALIAAGIATLLLGVLIAATHGARRGEETSEHDARLVAEQLTQENIERDLRRLVCAPDSPPVTISPAGDEMSFWVYEPSDAGDTSLAARPITYHMGKSGLERIEHGTSRVTRPGAPYMKQFHFAAEASPTGPVVQVRLGPHAFAVRIGVPRGLSDETLAAAYAFRPLAEFPDSRR